jgi:MFS transporter, putative metabolite:H+ symporter
VLAAVLALFGIETNRRSLEEIAPDTSDAFAGASSLSQESHR